VSLSTVPALDWLVPVVRFLPFTAGGLMLAMETPDFGPGAPDYDFFSRWASGGIFAIFVALILGLAWLLGRRRQGRAASETLSASPSPDGERPMDERCAV
jgi:ABC-2 type transport system permease protein